MDMLFTYFVRTSHTSSLVVGVFLLGLGAGSYLIHRYKAYIRRPSLFLISTQFALGLYSLAFFYNLYAVLPALSTLPLAGLASLLLVIPTTILGATFALVADMSEKSTGYLYALDLSGAVTGSFLCGFVLIPAFGVQTSALIAGFISVCSGICLATNWKRWAAGLAAVIMVLSPIATDTLEEKPGINTSTSEDTLQTKPPEVSQPFVKNTAYGTIRLENNWLFINKIPQCSYNKTYEEGKSERKLAEEALRDLNESRVANIGLGCGSTLDKIQQYSNATIDVVEINPAVINLTKGMTDLLEDNSTNIYEQDGFLHMKNTPETYDSVIIDVPKPSIAYSSDLYTKEMFQAVKTNLREGGTLGLWVPPCHTEQGNQQLFNILESTLDDVYKYTYRQGIIMIASDTRLDINSPRFNASEETPPNTIDKKTLESFYSRECEWKREEVFRDNYGFAFD